MKLKNRIALVTGASRGLGEAISLALAHEGAKIIVNYCKRKDLAVEVVKEIESMGSEAVAICADVRNTEAVNGMIQQVLEEYGGIDILVNNAGVNKDSVVWKMTDEMWEDVIDVCLTGTFKCTRAVINDMRKKQYGRILNISSVVGHIGVIGTSNYSAAKSGLFGFTKSIAKEVASKGITVNALSLGYFNSGMLLRLSKEYQETIKQQIPVNRFGSLKELTDTVLFLVSESSSYITGQTVHLNGGFYM